MSNNSATLQRMGVRYIGSKKRIAEKLVSLMTPPEGRFVDAFCGSGAVAAVAAAKGWPVTLNDALPSAVSMSIGACIGKGNVDFRALGGYDQAIETLNSLPLKPGFIHSEYSPASINTRNIERRYFTERNAAHIDTARAQIAKWEQCNCITELEKQLLIADLIQAANSVANISGTYGGFLKKWTTTAKRTFKMHPRTLPNLEVDLKYSTGDASAINSTEADIVYLDPPYTKRQYSAYYHILETIYEGDSPTVDGVTGLRPWKDKASSFCYKNKAFTAILELFENLKADRIYLSYSNEGHVPRQQLIEGLTPVGTLKVHEIEEIGRYRPNAGASASGSTSQEFLIEMLNLSSEHTSPTDGAL